MKKTLRLGRKIVSTLVRDRVYYPGRLATETAGIVARYGVLLILYWYVFRLKGGEINGLDFETAAWSMFFYFAFSVWRLRVLSREIMRDVQSGNVEILFSKPVSYIAYRMWWQLGAGIYPFLLISVVGALALALVVGLPATMLLGMFLPTLFLTLAFSVLLSLFLYTVVGLLAFWMEDINPVFWIVDKSVMILGGSYLPVALFPDFMYKVALFSPFGATQFATHTVYGTWSEEWLLKVGMQVFWVIIIMLFVYVLFTKAKKKVSVNGG